MIASTTQITPRSWAGTLLLLVHIARVRKQLKTAKGLLKLDFGSGWKTLTVWESLADLKAFRNSGAHAKAMRDTGKIGRATTVTWEVDRPPTWSEVAEKLSQSASAH